MWGSSSMTVATYAAAQLIRMIPRQGMSRIMGRLSDAKLPAPVAEAVVGAYVRAFDVDLADTVAPNGSYPSFDAFFTRPLRAGARPLCEDPAAIVSPSDGRVEDAGLVSPGGTLLVKGKPYAVADLVGDSVDSVRYQGGQFAIVYLSPRDYHRVHAPVDGEITEIRSLPGDLFPVNAIGERHIPSLFAKNRRVAIVIDTEDKGRITVVMVGAMVVGRITVSAIEGRDVPLGRHLIQPSKRIRRGEEIGVFHLGSTAVVFVEKGKAAPFGRVESKPGKAWRIRMGEPLSGGDDR